MKLLGHYINGNVHVGIFDDGTKIRRYDDIPKPIFPESIDLKITNYCDIGCPYCHEDSKKTGDYARNLLSFEFLKTLRPYTELAIGGGNPLSHPNFENFLKFCKERKIIANITVHQIHFLQNYKLLKYYEENELVYGIGISAIDINDDFIYKVKNFKNAALHIINGIITKEDFLKLAGKELKILILGYKDFGRGIYFKNPQIKINQNNLRSLMPGIFSQFKVVSFDNLALEQLRLKYIIPKKYYETHFMGEDGQYTMYIDLVKQEFAKNSISSERFKILPEISEMFKKIR